MKKRCCSCGCTFTLSGSGKRQKYCSECAKRGDGRVWGLSASNPLNIKGAEKPFEEAWVDRLNGLKDHEGPIALLGPDGQLWRLWPTVEKEKTEARHWRLFARGVTNAMTPPPPRKTKAPASPPKGFRLRLCIDTEKELQVLGCGWRIVTCQFRGNNVLLHHNGSVASMKRQAFRDLVSANRRLRRKRPKLRLVVSNPEPRMAVTKQAA